MKTFEFSNADVEAIKRDDYAHLNDKGVEAYLLGDYEVAKEYYLLASSMGCPEATCNLGYYYLEKANPISYSKAVCYFSIAANMGNVDAIYKLGDIYRNGIGVVPDVELGLYYFKQAYSIIDDPKNGLDYRSYPNLFFALGKEYSKGGAYPENISLAYIYLKNAIEGYEIQLDNGINYNEEAYNACKKLISSRSFSGAKKEYEKMIEDLNK